MSDPARRATDKDRELAERHCRAHGPDSQLSCYCHLILAALAEQREHDKAFPFRSENFTRALRDAVERAEAAEAALRELNTHQSDRIRELEAERDDCRSIVADYERIAVLEDHHQRMMTSGNAIVEPTNMRAVFDRIRELEAKIRSIEEPAKRPLHIEGCPYRPYADKVLDPEEEEAAPDCTCPEEHMANYWKACWVLEKSQREIQIRELEAQRDAVCIWLCDWDEGIEHGDAGALAQRVNGLLKRRGADLVAASIRIRELEADGRRRVLSGWVPISPEVAGRTDGAQIVDGQWYAPAWGCDSLQHGIDAAIAAEGSEE